MDLWMRMQAKADGEKPVTPPPPKGFTMEPADAPWITGDRLRWLAAGILVASVTVALAATRPMLVVGYLFGLGVIAGIDLLLSWISGWSFGHAMRLWSVILSLVFGSTLVKAWFGRAAGAYFLLGCIGLLAVFCLFDPRFARVMGQRIRYRSF